METIRVVNCPSQDLALTNCVYCAPGQEKTYGPLLEIGEMVLMVKPAAAVEPGCIALNSVQRKTARVASGEEMQVQRFRPPKEDFELAMVTAELDFVSKVKGKAETLDAVKLTQDLVKRFGGHVLTIGQRVSFEVAGSNFVMAITSVEIAGLADASGVSRGMLAPKTAFVYESVNTGIKVSNQRAGGSLFKTKDFSFQKLGIGGLDVQFSDIFRRAFASRVYPPAIIAKLGIKHVKGMLLYGPPGTGKTLIARQIGKMLNGREPKIVNGPEILNKYVGASEENVRNLFKDAEAEQKLSGDDSGLHIIIFDEIDAICKQRGSQRDGTGTGDTVVNQLLTKIDGVDALNNVLLIGMTNRKDMLDEALLRPGRLEVLIEIGLPDEAGRRQILGIHTSKMDGNQFLSHDIDLGALAARTKNFSGAEIEGLIKSAVSFALSRTVDLGDLSGNVTEENIKVTLPDFEQALMEVKPAFGAATDLLERCLTNGIINYGPAFDHLTKTIHTLVDQVRNSERTPLMACLLSGPAGSGKTALAASVALASEFPFIKMISAETMVQDNETNKIVKLLRVFEDAYKSPLSIIVLDGIERILEYVSIGSRFSNGILQALLVLVKRMPPPGRKLLVIGTTSMADVLETMELKAAFNVCLDVPALDTEEVKKVLSTLNVFGPADVGGAMALLDSEMPIKRLLMLIEMSRQSRDGGVYEGRVPLDRFVEVMTDLAG